MHVSEKILILNSFKEIYSWNMTHLATSMTKHCTHTGYVPYILWSHKCTLRFMSSYMWIMYRIHILYVYISHLLSVYREPIHQEQATTSQINLYASITGCRFLHKFHHRSSTDILRSHFHLSTLISPKTKQAELNIATDSGTVCQRAHHISLVMYLWRRKAVSFCLTYRCWRHP